MSWIELLDIHPVLLGALGLLLGLIVGSFLNVVIWRLPRILDAGWRRECAELLGLAAEGPAPPLSLAYPPSTCPHCGHRIRIHENIPILSYLMLRGRCSACSSPIGIRYPLIEGLTALLTLIVVWAFGPTWPGAAALILTWTLIALAAIDLDTQLLPDAITQPMLWLGLILSLFGVFADSHSAIIGAVAGYLSLWTVFQLFRLTTGREGMGYGDFKLLAMLGAWLGWQYLPQILLLSAVVGALTGSLLILMRRHEAGRPLPFGPYLAAAGWISLMWGDAINVAYLQLSGLAG
ncbi:prepilin peptidase [Caldichromatium japonicum]|uniref:Prepilin leader peptidase/N-methyltransferase n=1 Tax=Caldichromatium japonicum TaxID=2699430 RepID=A0A6G7VFR3_9GAMM|nr:A24 family peptidase [Caldichromatium japonicum]QIK38824.1 prepilin peptidase [Caldichromatium japonicum]